MSLSLDKLHKTLQESFGADVVSMDTVKAIKTLVEDYTSEQLKTKDAEIAFIKEQAELYAESKVKDKDAEIAFIKEQAELYAQSKVEDKDAEIAFIKEQAELYAESKAEDKDAEIAFIKEQAELYAQSKVEELSEKFNQYSGYVVEQFVEDNSARLVEHSEYLKMKAVFEQVKQAFETNMFPLSENAIVDKMQTRLDEADKQYSRLFKEAKLLRQYANYVERQTIIESVCEDLTVTQKEKIAKLTESVKDMDDFKDSVKSFAKDYRKSGSKGLIKESDDTISKYADMLNNKNTIDIIPVPTSQTDISKYVDYLQGL